MAAWTERQRVARGLYRRFAPPIGALAVVIVAWYLILRVTRTPDFILPTPDRILAALILDYGLIFRHTLLTLRELVPGLVLGVVIGLVGALTICWSRAAEVLLMPWIVTFESTPKIIIAPLIALWFGFDLGPKIGIVALLVFFPLLVSTVSGLRSLPDEMLDLMRSMGASKRQVFLHARIPASLPYVLSGAKLAGSLAMVGAIVSEWVGAEGGLGFLLIQSHNDFQTGRLFATLIVVAGLSMGIYLAVGILERVALPWHVSMRERFGPDSASL